MAEIFISYSRLDSEFVDKLIRELESKGIKVWIDRDDIEGGDKWRAVIVQAISQCRAFLLILSPNSVNSENVSRELSLAESKRRLIIPIVYQSCDIPHGMEYQLAELQRIDFRQSYGEALQRLVRVLIRPTDEIARQEQPPIRVSHFLKLMEKLLSPFPKIRDPIIACLRYLGIFLPANPTRIIVTMLVLFLALVYYVMPLPIPTPIPRPQGARFDSSLTKSRLIELADRNRVELTWQLFPLSKKPDESATVFIGIVVLHDENKIVQAGFGERTAAPCEKVASCVGSHVFRKLSSDPVYIKANSPGSPFTAPVDVRYVPEYLRIWWEFYQLEGDGEYHCGIDDKSGSTDPEDGIPPLATFDAKGNKVGNACYRSSDQQTISATQLKSSKKNGP